MRSVTKLERRSRGRVPADAQPGRAGVARLRSLRGRSGSPCHTRPRQLRQSSGSQNPPSCAGNTGVVPRPAADQKPRAQVFGRRREQRREPKTGVAARGACGRGSGSCALRRRPTPADAPPPPVAGVSRRAPTRASCRASRALRESSPHRVAGRCAPRAIARTAACGRSALYSASSSATANETIPCTEPTAHEPGVHPSGGPPGTTPVSRLSGWAPPL